MPRSVPLIAAVAASGLVAAAAAPVQALQIVINPNETLAANAAALAAFNRAAAAWEARFTDNISVTIDAGLASLGAGVLGQASSETHFSPYSTIRAAMVADAAGAFNNGIVSSLPTAMPTFLLPAGFSNDDLISATKANLKALGFTGLDEQYGATDATITFSTNFSFDFDNSNGVGAGLIDFESVALHEIGHALGFISDLDYIDVNVGADDVAPSTLDLFRFSSASNPTAATFGTTARDLRPTQASFFDDGQLEILLSTGKNKGDGNQGSHFKDDLGIGIMDPTLGYGEIGQITYADLRVFDLIGWDLDLAYVPEPATLAAIGGVAVVALRRRRATLA